MPKGSRSSSFNISSVCADSLLCLVGEGGKLFINPTSRLAVKATCSTKGKENKKEGEIVSGTKIIWNQVSCTNLGKESYSFVWINNFLCLKLYIEFYILTSLLLSN